MYLIIDTETNGLPNMHNIKYGDYPLYTNIEKYNTARVIQISFMICDENLNEIEMHDYVIKRQGFDINNYEFHNITNEISDNGFQFDVVMNIFYEKLKLCKYIIAHNINFDINVIKSELFRRQKYDLISLLENYDTICTVKTFKYIVKAKNKYNKIKDPSLKELYYYAFKKDIENAHNSKYDVINLHKATKYLMDNNKSIKLK